MLRNKLQLDYKAVQIILPLDYEHVIEKRDPVVSFKEVIGGLRLSKYIKTSKKGRQEYEAEVMLELILFGYMENIRSLRNLEKACKTDIRFMYLSQGTKPSFMAFQRFINTKLKESIDDIFTAVCEYLIKQESINREVLYVDGTKIEANANKFSFVWKKSVIHYQKALQLKLTKLLKSINKDLGYYTELKDVYEPQDIEGICFLLETQIEKEGIQFVYGKGKHKQTIQRYYEGLREYQSKLNEYEKHLEILGERNGYSKTDNDATFMHGKEDYYSKTGIFKPYYNIQIGVSDEYILHYGVYHNPSDTKTWTPFFNSYYSRYGYYPSYPVADAGYGNYDNYLYNLNHNMNLSMKYVMFSKENEKKFKKKRFDIKNMRQTQDGLISDDGHVYKYSHEYYDTRGEYLKIKQVYRHEDWQESYKVQKIPKQITKDVVLLELQAEARRLLKSAEGIELRVRRSIEVEGAFGEIKADSNYTRIHRRGKRSVETEIGLVLLGYNLRKYHAKKYRILH